MMNVLVFDSSNTNPYMNLALEEYLLNVCRIHQKPILYLWQNANTVVVGKNQNLYTECNMPFLRNNNILPARRMTGGGAVYHDLGNINYTIITPKDQYNIEKNTGVIIEALKVCGLDAYKNGRNDICTPKGKISGNAYYSDDLVGLQHGTVLYRADVAAIEGALSISESKLTKKGIKSVSSRICDVISQSDNITISDIKESIVNVFLDSYRIETYINRIDIEKHEFDKLKYKYSSKEWIEGIIKEYSISKKTSLSWGEVEVHVLLTGESISEIDLYTDCIDVMFVENIRNELSRCVKQQTYKVFPTIDIQDNAILEYKDWLTEFDDFFKSMLLEIGFEYANTRM